MIEGAAANVLDFGADPTGTDDSAAAIQSALDSLSTSGGIVYIPQGVYKISSSILIDGNISVYGAGTAGTGSAGTALVIDSDVLEGVKVGSVTIFGGQLSNFTVRRAAYSGATENVGIAWYNCAQSLFENLESRLSKYPMRLQAGNTQRVSYSTWINPVCVGGYYNLSNTVSGSGFVNENVFLGGRMFTTSDTDTNIYFNVGNHNRFICNCLEGAGVQAVYIGGHSNYIESPRTEGTWSTNDIVVDAAALYITIIAPSLYTTITDNGENTQFITSLQGTRFATGVNGITSLNVVRAGASGDIPATKIEDTYSAFGNSYGIEYRFGRYNNTSYVVKALRDSDDFDVFHVDTTGQLFAARKLESGQSEWNYSPLVLGDYTFWVDALGRLRIKNGTPTSDTDGTIVGTQS